MDIRSAIQKLAKQDVFESILGKVTSIDTGKKLCTVQPLDDQPEILEVRLSAVESPENGHVIIPTEGSFVIVGQTATQQPHVLMFSEIDSVSTIIDGVEYKLDANGMGLTVGSNDLKEGLQDLKTAIGQLKVMTSQGQSSIPINISDINSAFAKILGTLQ